MRKSEGKLEGIIGPIAGQFNLHMTTTSVAAWFHRCEENDSM